MAALLDLASDLLFWIILGSCAFSFVYVVAMTIHGRRRYRRPDEA